MVSKPPLGCWADLPSYYCPRVWCSCHTWGGILKRESSPTLTKYYWVVQFISHEHLLFLNASFEIEINPLNFNKKKKSSRKCRWIRRKKQKPPCRLLIIHRIPWWKSYCEAFNLKINFDGKWEWKNALTKKINKMNH